MGNGLRVAHVTWSGHVGGIERLILDLTREQRRTGLDPAVLMGQGTGPFADNLRADGTEVVDLRLRSGIDLRPEPIRRAIQWVRKADIVHVHAFNAPLGAVATAARRPVIFTEHGNFGLGRPMGLQGLVKLGFQSAFLRRAAHSIAANSQYTAGVALALYRLDPSRVRVVHNGTAFENTRSTTREDDRSSRLQIATLGRLVGNKRIDRVIDGVALMKPDLRPEVMVIGDGPLLGGLKARTKRHDIEDHIRFLGIRHDVAELLASVDVLVHPSTAEPFGLAVVEACARGVLPVLFADGGGVLEVLPPDGIVVSSPAELASVLEGLDRALLTDAARQARATLTAERFSIERTANTYVEMYRSALEASLERSKD